MTIKVIIIYIFILESKIQVFGVLGEFYLLLSNAIGILCCVPLFVKKNF